MKSVLSLCLLVVLCTVNAIPAPSSNDFDSLRRQVNDAKYNVENDIHRIERLRSNTVEDTNREVNDVLIKHENNYRDYKDDYLRDIRIKIEDAKDKGKEVNKVDKCYKDVVDGLNTAETTAKQESLKCVNSSEISIRNNLRFLDNLIETGHMLISELDDVFVDCHDIDKYKKMSCIIGKLSTINADIRKFEDDILHAEIGVVSPKNNVVKQADKCIDNAYSPLQTQGDRLKIGLQTCLE